MAARIKPLQEAATILAGVIGKKKGELKAFLEETNVKLEQLVSGPLVDKLKAQNRQVLVTVAECKVKYHKLHQRVQQEMP